MTKGNARPPFASWLLALLAGAAGVGCGPAPERHPDAAATEDTEEERAPEPHPTSLAPIADTFVRNGGGGISSLNFGRSTTLDVENGSSGSYREAYLRFSLSSFTGTVQRARLRVFGQVKAAGSVPVVARLMSTELAPFSETATTYDNRPQTMPIELARVRVNETDGAWHEFDVTSLARERKRAGSPHIDFALLSPVVSDTRVQFNAREASSDPPQLVIDTATALFVVGDTTLGAGDAAIGARLGELGFSVTIQSAPDVTSADANGHSLVLVSSTVTARDVNTKFTRVAVPVLAWEGALYDDLKMTGPTNGSDYGTTARQDTVRVASPSHALAGGRTGSPALSASDSYTWGKPGAGAVIVATLAGDRARATVFGYERGADMVGRKAPARRVGLFLGDLTARSLTRGGWALFDAAVNWASGSKAFTLKKVLVINYEPFLEAFGQTVSEHYKWPGARAIVANFLRDIPQITGDYVRYEVTRFVDLDAWPPQVGLKYGASYNDADYVADFERPGCTSGSQCRSGSCTLAEGQASGSCTQNLQNAPADYNAIIARFGLDAAIDAGSYDEVFVAAPTGLGFHESAMVGNDAYWVNGGPIVHAGVRNYFIMYVDNLVHWSNFEHSWCHRVENVMRHVYGKSGYGQDLSGIRPGNWNTNPYDFACLWPGASPACGARRRHFLDDFTLVDGVAQGLRRRGDRAAVAGVGTMHFVANAQAQGPDNYNWGQPWAKRALAAVPSRADDWLFNFPNLTGETRLLSMSEYPFGPTDDKHHWGYVMFLFNHVPRMPGRHADNVLYNWWEYVVNFNDYPEALR